MRVYKDRRNLGNLVTVHPQPSHKRFPNGWWCNGKVRLPWSEAWGFFICILHEILWVVVVKGELGSPPSPEAILTSNPKILNPQHWFFKLTQRERGGGEKGGIISKCVPASSTCKLLTTSDEQAFQPQEFTHKWYLILFFWNPYKIKLTYMSLTCKSLTSLSLSLSLSLHSLLCHWSAWSSISSWF